MALTKEQVAGMTKLTSQYQTVLNVDELTAKATNKYIEKPSYTLREVTELTPELIDDKPFFEIIRSLYTQDGNQFVMVLASVCNAIATQEAGFFVTSRRSLWQLVKNDPNHKVEFSLGWKKYGAVLSYLFECKIIERIEMSEGRKAGIFKTVNFPLLRFILDGLCDYYSIDADAVSIPELCEVNEIKEWRKEEYKAVRGFRDHWNGREANV